jgi:hypothetical protein
MDRARFAFADVLERLPNKAATAYGETWQPSQIREFTRSIAPSPNTESD